MTGPKTVEFRAELPLSGAGKILKRDLREPYWAGRETALPLLKWSAWT